MESSNVNKPVRNTVPRGLVITQIIDAPLPQKDKNGELIRSGITKIANGKCMKVKLTSERTLIEWHRYISSICSNYKKKTNGEVRFTVVATEDDEICIWRIK